MEFDSVEQAVAHYQQSYPDVPDWVIKVAIDFDAKHSKVPVSMQQQQDIVVNRKAPPNPPRKHKRHTFPPQQPPAVIEDAVRVIRQGEE